MMMHPSLLLDLAHDHHRQLIADADRERLLTLARRGRKPWTARGRKAGAGRGQPSGTLASCEPSVAVPAR